MEGKEGEMRKLIGMWRSWPALHIPYGAMGSLKSVILAIAFPFPFPLSTNNKTSHKELNHRIYSHTHTSPPFLFGILFFPLLTLALLLFLPFSTYFKPIFTFHILEITRMENLYYKSFVFGWTIFVLIKINRPPFY